MFGINGSEFVIIALVALFIFGPDRLPGAAKSAARLLHDVRRWTVKARADLNDTLGPEFENFDLADLNPKRFVQKHLLEGLDDLDLDLDGEKERRRRELAAEQAAVLEPVGATSLGTLEAEAAAPDTTAMTATRVDGAGVDGTGTDGATLDAAGTDEPAPRPRCTHVDLDAT